MSAKKTLLKLKVSHPDPQVAFLLPSNIARHYQALPIAADGNRVTIAMTRPDDLAARQAVVDSLGLETYVVQAHPKEMERMLNELWPSNAEHRYHFLSWFPEDVSVGGDWYARSFARLMDARLTNVKRVDSGKPPGEIISSEVRSQHSDLVIIDEQVDISSTSMKPRMIFNQILNQIPTSILIIRNPYWPMRKLLLVLRDSKFDSAAISWVLRIAAKNDAAVTILPVIASAPPVFSGINVYHKTLKNLLSSTCPLGNMLRCVSQTLVNQKIQGTLRLREGTIVDQIRQEVEEYEYDFAVIAADAHRSIVRWMLGELVNPLLSISQVPTLIAKPR